MGRKLKRFKVLYRTTKGKTKVLGQELAFSKANAEKNVKKRFGSRAYVIQMKY
jgi:hypothetical protein